MLITANLTFMKTLKNWLPNAAAVLLGALLTFAFAPFEIFPFAVLAPAGLIALWLNASPRQAFMRGFLFGMGLFGAGVYWIYISIHLFGDIPPPLAALLTTGFVAVLALYPALVGYWVNRYFPYNNLSKLLCAYPAFWVFSEWLRCWLFTGFPWLLLGYSQTNSPLRGFAPILSVHGVSLAVIMTSALVVNAVQSGKQRRYQPMYFSLFAITAIWVAGGLLNLVPWTKPNGKTVQVSLVQGNIPQSIKWVPEHLQLSFDRYKALTEPLLSKDRLIIWPESAIPLPLQDAASFITTLDNKAKAAGASVILGIPQQERMSNGYFNSVIAVGEHHGAYAKRLLVPFGEYVPFSEYISSIFNALNVPMPDLVRGEYVQPPLSIGDLKILTSICYEIAFPELVRTNDPAISFMLTVTNDAWFGHSAAQPQHLQMAKMRALEMARPVVFVSNDGITAIIDADGQVQAAAPDHQVYVLNGQVQPTFGLTPWMRNGIDPMLFILLCLYIAAMFAKRKSMLAERAALQEPNHDDLQLDKTNT